MKKSHIINSYMMSTKFGSEFFKKMNFVTFLSRDHTESVGFSKNR